MLYLKQFRVQHHVTANIQKALKTSNAETKCMVNKQ